MDKFKEAKPNSRSSLNQEVTGLISASPSWSIPLAQTPPIPRLSLLLTFYCCLLQPPGDYFTVSTMVGSSVWIGLTNVDISKNVQNT